MYHVVFCVNRDFFSRLPVVIYSLCKNSTLSIYFHVFYSSECCNAEACLYKIINKYSNCCQIEFEQLEPKHIFDELGIDVPKWSGGYDAYSRAFVVDALHNKGVKAAVYLDADILCLSNIDELLKYCDCVRGIIGLISPSSDNFIYKHTRHKYVNSGVLVMNLDYLVNIDFVKSFINVFKITDFEYLKFPDQDAINMVIDDEFINGFECKFNTFSVNYKEGTECAILHYAGPKPWQFWRKWNHAKFIYYRELSKFKLCMWGVKKCEKYVDYIFVILEVLLAPLVGLLNVAHDLNHFRRVRRHKKHNKTKPM